MSSAFSPPLFSTVSLPQVGKRLFLTSCPGTRHTLQGRVAKAAFLADDLTRLNSAGIRLVLSCLAPRELMLGLEPYETAYRQYGIEWHLVPIPDMTAPTPELDIALDHSFAAAADVMKQGDGILIHCLAGLGRTGTVAARLAMYYGLSAAQAITLIRSQHSPKAIETMEQENYLMARELRQDGLLMVKKPCTL